MQKIQFNGRRRRRETVAKFHLTWPYSKKTCYSGPIIFPPNASTSFQKTLLFVREKSSYCALSLAIKQLLPVKMSAFFSRAVAGEEKSQ
jgi:hypothetical protein